MMKNKSSQLLISCKTCHKSRRLAKRCCFQALSLKWVSFRPTLCLQSWVQSPRSKNQWNSLAIATTATLKQRRFPKIRTQKKRITSSARHNLFFRLSKWSLRPLPRLVWCRAKRKTKQTGTTTRRQFQSQAFNCTQMLSCSRCWGWGRLLRKLKFRRNRSIQTWLRMVRTRTTD